MIAAALEAEVDDYVSSFSDELDEAGRRLRRVVEDRPKGLILPPSERIQRYEPSECLEVAPQGKGSCFNGERENDHGDHLSRGFVERHRTTRCGGNPNRD